MKKLILYLLIICSASVMGQNSGLFDEANQAYADGNYKTAVQKYEKILKNGQISAELYYNLGNAHYKLNHIAPSIYYYEKALQLKPGDDDIKNNIEFARNMTLDNIPASEQSGLQKSINNLISTFSFETWARFAIVAGILFVLLFILYYFTYSSFNKRMFFSGAALFLLLSIASVFFAYEQQDIQLNNQYAIVFSEEAPVRNEPNMRGEGSFVLHEGTKAKILEDYQGWIKIELANGTQGWMKEDAIKRL